MKNLSTVIGKDERLELFIKQSRRILINTNFIFFAAIVIIHVSHFELIRFCDKSKRSVTNRPIERINCNLQPCSLHRKMRSGSRPLVRHSVIRGTTTAAVSIVFSKRVAAKETIAAAAAKNNSAETGSFARIWRRDDKGKWKLTFIVMHAAPPVKRNSQ